MYKEIYEKLYDEHLQTKKKKKLQSVAWEQALR